MILQQSREAYDKLDGTNWSKLKHIGRSPEIFRHVLLKGDGVDTLSRKGGRVGHLAVFEPEVFARDVVMWDGGRRGTNAYKAFVDEHPGKEILNEEEYLRTLNIANAVRNHPLAGQYVTRGMAEPSMQWTFKREPLHGLPGYSILCKARPDFIADVGRAVVDLKIVRDASQNGFGRAVANYQHHGQAAMYSDGYAALKERRPFIFVAVEALPPHAVAVYVVNDEILELGRKIYTGYLDTLQVCRETNHWPGYSDGAMDIALPRWAVPAEEGIEDLGLTFNAGDTE